MIIDLFSYLGESRFGYGLSAEELTAGLRSNSIDGAIVAPTHRRDHDFETANREVAELPGSAWLPLMPLARVDPWDSEAAVRMLDDAVDRGQGARGLFLHPLEEHFVDDARVRPLARRAVELAIPIVVAPGCQIFSEPVQSHSSPAGVPRCLSILTDGSQFNISGLSQVDAGLALQHDNVYVHTSGVYRDDWISLVASTVGQAERMLFASAAPVMNTAYELRRVQLAHVPTAAKELILHGNVVQLFGDESWAS